MMNNNTIKCKLFNNDNFLKKISLFIILIFILNVYVLPSAYSVTIEEQALRKSSEKQNNSEDEFDRKTPARRDSNRGAQEKDPRLACLLSLIIPGAGEIYLRNDIKGIIFFALPIVGYSFAGYYLFQAFMADVSETEKKSRYLVSGLLLLVSVIIHIVGIVETYNDAIEINEKNLYYGTGKSKSPYIAQLLIE